MRAREAELGSSRPVPSPALRRLTAISNWPVWALPSLLRGYVLAVITAGAVVTALPAGSASWQAGQGILFGALLGFGAVTVESLRKIGEPAGSVKDAHGVWQTGVALLLPPVYSM